MGDPTKEIVRLDMCMFGGKRYIKVDDLVLYLYRMAAGQHSMERKAMLETVADVISKGRDVVDD